MLTLLILIYEFQEHYMFVALRGGVSERMSYRIKIKPARLDTSPWCRLEIKSEETLAKIEQRLDGSRDSHLLPRKTKRLRFHALFS